MKHTASARFWALYDALPKAVQAVADKNFQLLKTDSRHPSLHFKRLGKVWSVRVGEHHRALGHDIPAAFSGFGLAVTPTMIESLANNSLERSVEHRGRTVRAVAGCARAGAQWWRSAAAQLNR